MSDRVVLSKSLRLPLRDSPPPSQAIYNCDLALSSKVNAQIPSQHPFGLLSLFRYRVSELHSSPRFIHGSERFHHRYYLQLLSMKLSVFCTRHFLSFHRFSKKTSAGPDATMGYSDADLILECLKHVESPITVSVSHREVTL